MKNIQSVSDSYLCSNCGACSVICPKKCIKFEWTNIGRLKATIGKECVECGRCLRVCPSLDIIGLHEKFQDHFIGNIISVYHGVANNRVIFENAQSGGVATAILQYLFKNSMIDAAVVCKMEYGDIPVVKPIIVNSIDELNGTQKSFYTPVPLLEKIKEISEYKSVAVVGIPCHIQGITSLIKISSDYKNIKYKIGLICDRSECAGIQSVIKSFVNLNKFKIDWRCKFDKNKKKYNYATAPIIVRGYDGNDVVLPREYRIWLKDMFTPPRCRLCWDKLNVFADITLGDPWRITGIDEKKGESLVLTRTSIGQQLIDSMISSGALKLTKIENDIPEKSQLINERRRSVALYSKAFNSLSIDVDTYLLNQSTIVFDDKEQKKAIFDIYNFINLESKKISEIIKIGRQEIENFEKIRRQKNTSKNRMFCVVKSILRRIIRL